MPVDPNIRSSSPVAAFATGFASSFAGQDVVGTIERARERDELANDVRDFSLSLGDSPTAKKSFNETSKRFPGWNRDKASFREFVSNYHTLNNTTNAIDDAAAKGFFGDNTEAITKMYHDIAKNDPEGAVKQLNAQLMGQFALQEKRTFAAGQAEDKQKVKQQGVDAENQLQGLAFQAAQSENPSEFISALNVPADQKFEITELANKIKGDTGGDVELNANELFAARNTPIAKIPEAIAKLGIKGARAAAFTEQAIEGKPTDAQQAENQRKAKLRQEVTLSAIDRIIDEVSENPTEKDVRTFLRDNPDLAKTVGASVAEIQLGVKDRSITRAKQKVANLETQAASTQLLSGLKDRGLNTSGFSSTATAKNAIRFDPAKTKQERTFAGDPGVKNNDFVLTQDAGSFITSELNDGTIVGYSMPRLNGKADITLMRKDQNGNLVPSRDQTGKIQKVSPQQSKLQAMTILQDAISKGGEYEGEQPFDIMRTLVGKLKKDISSRSTAVKKEEFGPRLGRNRMRKSRMVANPDTNDGLLLIQLNGLEQNLIQRGSSKRGGLVTRTSGETDVDISNAAEQYLIYQELKNKMINSDAGVYGK